MSLYSTKTAETYDGASRLSVMATDARPSYLSYATNLHALYPERCLRLWPLRRDVKLKEEDAPFNFISSW